MAYYAKIINLEGGELMVSIADEDLLGKKFARDGVSIDVSPLFYGDKTLDDEDATKYIKLADILILTGSKIVNKAIEEGVVNPESVLEIDGVKHVQVFRFNY
ncbi:MAG: DUF424 family protein [Caldisphaeraceae archaeon]|nr:DUF424 family protein [Caldisphaeraceae archaeon]